MSKVSIHDIAKLAGVTVGTVSKALNGYTNVSAETRARVQRIANEMGYIPNATARALITKTNKLVGVLFSDDLDIGLEHPIFNGIINSFKGRMEESGYDTIFIGSWVGSDKRGYLDHCRYRNVDGVYIVTFGQQDQLLLDLVNSEIKCVTTDEVTSIDIPAIMSNNYEGMEKAIDYLVDLGHTKIGHIAGPVDTNLISKERYLGYLRYMNKHKLEVEDNYVKYVQSFDYDAGYKAAKDLIERCKDNMPTALTVAGDLIAVGLMDGLIDSGINVPQDISVIGFDDINVSRYCKPALTTIRQNTSTIGRTVAEVLLKSIQGESVPHKHYIGVQLIERNSCISIK